MLRTGGVARMTSFQRVLMIGLVAFVSAVAGVFVGQQIVDKPRASETELHAQLHERLDLTAEQRARLEQIEADFTARHHALEQEMRAANVRLAKAMQAEHGYGPEVTLAIDHSHQVMGSLQKETLQHLFAMREVLDPEQAEVFDSIVVKALTADAR